MQQSGWPTDPDHPLIKRLINDAVEANGGWQHGSPTNTLDALRAFIAAVDWTPPQLLTLSALHTSLLIAALTIARRHYIAQFALIALCWAAVLCSERLNTYCRQHSDWIGLRSDHFDVNGVFVSAVWSVPLAIVAFVTLLCLLYEASSLLIVVKRKELKVEQKQRQRQRQPAVDGTTSTAAPTTDTQTTIAADGAQQRTTASHGRRKQVNNGT